MRGSASIEGPDKQYSIGNEHVVFGWVNSVKNEGIYEDKMVVKGCDGCMCDAFVKG